MIENGPLSRTMKSDVKFNVNLNVVILFLDG